MAPGAVKAPVAWSARARSDLRGIIFYLKERSPQAAARFAQEIRRRAGRLGTFPESGRVVPEFSDEHPAPRELIIADYRLVYDFHDRRAEILALFHGRRQFPEDIFQ